MPPGNLIELPAETQHHIYSYVDPEDLPRMSLVCRRMCEFLRENKQLDREIITRVLDAPGREDGASFDYRQYLRDSVTFSKILAAAQDVDVKANLIEFVTRFATLCLQYASPSRSSPNIDLLNQSLEHPSAHIDKENVESLLCSSTTYARARAAMSPLAPASLLTYAKRQASAKLHVLYGVAQMAPRRGKSRNAYGFAASMVYDLRNYKDANSWGPYRDTGDFMVDWEKMEAVMIVLSFNLERYREHTAQDLRPHGVRPFLGATPGSFVHKPSPLPHRIQEPIQDPLGLSKDGIDPYNVSGSWFRVDFHDLFAYNFTMGQFPPDQPRPELVTTEAIRIIRMEITATHFGKPDPEDGQELPVVYFEGISRSLHDSWDPNANSKIRGSVRLTREGEVRWSTISVYGGEERWRSEGIQVGGRDSARGVLGYWFDKDYGNHGPAGPTMFWKTSNDITERPVGPPQDEEDDEEEDPDFGEEGHEEDESDDEMLVLQHIVYTIVPGGLVE